MARRNVETDEDDLPISNPEFALEKFFLSVLIGLGSWLGGRTGQAIWDKGVDVFGDNDEPDTDAGATEVHIE